MARHLMASIICIFSLAAMAFQPEPAFQVWETPAATADWQAPDRPTVSRARPIVINPDFFALATQARWHLEHWPQLLDLDLFPDVHAVFQIENAYEAKSGGLVLTGGLEGIPGGMVHAVIHREVAIFDVAFPNALYHVRYVNDDLHQVLQIDQANFPADLEPTPVNLPGPHSPALPPAAAGENTTVDVMVVYTETAKNQEGGVSAIEALIDLAIVESNTSYMNSEIGITLNLVHQAEIDYNETSSMSTDRNRLQNPGDGFMDEAHDWRVQYGADIVALIRGDLGSSCGIAYIMNPVTPDFFDHGFCVVSRFCATGYYSFGHELGHIMSARHDWAVDPSNNAPWPFNHGYVHGSWRTIMGYPSACGGCTRIIYWSNPEVLFNGDPMGVPEGQPQPSSNAKALNMTATTVAAFSDQIICEEDAYEPNNALAPDQILTASIEGEVYADLITCPGDPDIFTVDVPGGHTLEIQVAFTHANGDLNLRLYNEAGIELDVSDSTTDNEMLTAPVEASETRYYVEVAGLGAASNDYVLTLKDEPGETQIFAYWLSENSTMCSDGPPTILNLLCYMNNGYECPPAPCQ